MHKLAICPNCDIAQSRLDIFEPYLSCINQCQSCGIYYRTSKKHQMVFLLKPRRLEANSKFFPNVVGVFFI
ncbi:MAG: hypothetical protein ACI8XC_002634 [Gammaproteobacteria bacterium]|jgi:hypothetical protein